MQKLFGDGFLRNLLIALLVTIIVGSIFSSGIGWAANFYFGQTLRSLIGDLGEYDLIISVRQPTKEVAAQKLEEIIQQQLPGVKWKEGTPLPGKANFFLSFPDKYRNKQVWQNLDQYFAALPGKSGYTVMLEPRINLRGIPVAAQGFLLPKLEAIPEIDFIFRDGGNLQLVLQEKSQVPEVTKKVKEVLAHYKLFTLYFPLGYKPADPVGLGNQLAVRLEKEFDLSVAQNIVFSNTDEKSLALNQTMGQMRSFLLAYASQVTVQLLPQVALEEKEQLYLDSPEGPLLLQVQNLAGSKARGIIIEGKAHNLLGKKVYTLKGDKEKGEYVGTVSQVENPKEQLQQSLRESIALLNSLEELQSQGLDINQGALQAIATYQQMVPQVKEVRNQVGNLQKQVEKNPFNLKLNLTPYGDRLDKIETRVEEINNLLTEYQLRVAVGRNKLTKSKAVLGGQLPEGILQLIESIEKGYQQESYLLGKTQDKLAAIQGEVNRGKASLNALQKVNKLEEINASLQQTMGSLDSLVNTLDSFNAEKTQQQMVSLSQTLNQLGKVDEQQIIASLEHLQRSLPTLQDQEIGSSVSLMDDYLAKQLASDQGLVILTDNWLPQGPAEKIAREVLQNSEVSALSSQVGVVDTDMRGEIQRIISSIREILSALSALAFTLLILILDQSTIMSTLKVLEEKKKGWWSLAHAYGTLVGSVLLLLLVTISNGSIPYLYPGHYLILGALLGYLAACQCTTLSPVDKKEITAGQALGLSYQEIMEQIVIPAAKPGFLKICNRNKVIFRGGKKGAANKRAKEKLS